MAETIRFGPCHPRQKMVLQDAESDILLIGGGKIVLPLNLSNSGKIQNGQSRAKPNIVWNV